MIESIASLSQGNPGSLTVLMKIIETDPMFLNPLGIALILTKTNSCALWQVYKDKCDYDVYRTKTYLKTWFDHSTTSLNDYLEDNEPPQETDD